VQEKRSLSGQNGVPTDKKRCIFNLESHMAYWQFGMLDSVSQEFDRQDITRLEEELMEWLNLIREQVTVVRSTLKSVNQTIHEVSNNEY
jgi:hypothetical protein